VTLEGCADFLRHGDCVERPLLSEDETLVRRDRCVRHAGIALLAMLCACTGRIQPGSSGGGNAAGNGGSDGMSSAPGGGPEEACVAGDPSRASTYVRKSFLTLDAAAQPSNWNVDVRIIGTTPPSDLAGRTRDFEARFNLTEDKVQLVQSGPNEPGGVVDAWPAASVDFDNGCGGPEDQAQDWQLRQWSPGISRRRTSRISKRSWRPL
jgi:hypothetical protein